MELKIQALHFDMAEKLEAFVNKKIEKLVRRNPAITAVNVTFKVVKPETAMNKEAVVEVIVPQQEGLVSDKTADTFEEALDLCLDALAGRLEKLKNRE